MADLKRMPGCHVYWGTAPLKAGIDKLPKEKIILFNIDSEPEPELKDLPSFKAPFDKERPVPLESFDSIVKALIDEGDKTQCVFSSKEEIPATLGNVFSKTNSFIKIFKYSKSFKSLVLYLYVNVTKSSCKGSHSEIYIKCE